MRKKDTGLKRAAKGLARIQLPVLFLLCLTMVGMTAGFLISTDSALNRLSSGHNTAGIVESYALHMELNRVEYNNNHRETRRHISLDTGLEHSEWLRSYDSDVYQQIAAEEDAANIRAAIDALSDSQKDLIQKIFDEGMSIKDYAEACGVKPSAISHRIRTIRNNLKEILK